MSVPYVVYDAAGRILRSGTCPKDQMALQAGAGEQVLQGDGRDDTHQVVNGRLVPRPPDPPPPPDIDRERLAAYPPLSDFADAYYWQQMGDPSKMQAWRDRVTAVKKAYPKP
jgi:hypothetical protein